MTPLFCSLQATISDQEVLISLRNVVDLHSEIMEEFQLPLSVTKVKSDQYLLMTTMTTSFARKTIKSIKASLEQQSPNFRIDACSALETLKNRFKALRIHLSDMLRDLNLYRRYAYV